MFYVIVIAAANVLTIAANCLASPPESAAALLRLSLSVAGATASVIALDGLTAFLLRRLPGGWFAPERAAFRADDAERRFYKRLGIRRWKGLVPELGGFTGFHKDTLCSTSDSAYLYRFLLESNYGVVIHLVNALCGLLLPPLPWCRAPGVWIPVAAVNFILNLLPAAVLRYNTPPLRRLYERSLRRGGKTA